MNYLLYSNNFRVSLSLFYLNLEQKPRKVIKVPVILQRSVHFVVNTSWGGDSSSRTLATQAGGPEFGTSVFVYARQQHDTSVTPACWKQK